MVDIDRLRELSGITLSEEGVFLHQGSVIENPKIQRLFSRGIALTPDGRATLTVGPQWCFIEPVDTLYVVQGVAFEDDGLPVLRLNDESREGLAVDSIFLDAAGGLYCDVKNGAAIARFGRTAYHQLSQAFVESEGESGVGLVLQGEVSEVPVRERGDSLIGRRSP